MKAPRRYRRPPGVLVACIWLLAACQPDAATPAPSTPNSDASTTPEEWSVPPPGPPDPGRVVLHRLNRLEFQNTTQALLATEVATASLLPADGVGDNGEGFDNDAEAQIFSVLHLETIETAVNLLLDDALKPPVTVVTHHLEAESDAFSGSGDEGCGMDAYPFTPCTELWFDAATSAAFNVVNPGPYTVRMRVCQAYNDVNPDLAFILNNEIQLQWEVTAGCKSPAEPEIVEGQVTLEAGLQYIGARQITKEGAKMISVDWIELEGPLDADGAQPPGRSKLYTCDPDTGGETCAREIVAGFMREAWRRPVTNAEVDTVMSLYTEAIDGGSDVHHGIRVALTRVLLSVHFLFRVEVPDTPDADTPQNLGPHELATRLSYFLWSTAPDAELAGLADDGTLLDDGVLEAQARRMLADPRAEALMAGMGAQWFGLRLLDEVAPAPATFPEFDNELRAAMAAEVEHLVRSVLLEGAPMTDLLTARETWVEPRLAEHYGLSATEAGMMAVPGRGAGLLTMAGWLTATSNPTRTSPVRRGKWVLTNLLCEKPPPPPDGVEAELDDTGASGTIAEQLALHRADPVCASCHDQIDPIGLALEPFDGIGADRPTYFDGTAVDPAGNFLGVGAFDDVVDLAGRLATQERTTRCFAQRTFSYALGRHTQAHDWPYFGEVEQKFADGGYTFEELVVAIVLSAPFREHRGEPEVQP